MITKEELRAYLSDNKEAVFGALSDVLFSFFTQKEFYPDVKKTGSKQPSVEETTADILRALGMNHGLNGYFYCISAVKVLLKNGRPKKINMSKDLYPIVAKEYNATCSQVERNIRTAILSVLSRDDAAEKIAVFGYPDVNQVSNVTSFLLAIADKVYTMQDEC